MKRSCIAAFVVCALSWSYCGHAVQLSAPNGRTVCANFSVAYVLKDRTTGVQVEGEGTVIRVLPDDLDGDKHQRFIVRLAPGNTVLITHNIDIAPRVAGLKNGELIRFYGEYVRNGKGGVVHWTHHDPKGRHVAGWLKHNGQIYQ